MKNLFDSSISLESLSSLLSQAPVALAMLMGEDMVIKTANSQCLQFWGKSSEIIGLPLIEALPEIADQQFPEILRNVLKTGEIFKGSKVKALLEKDGVLGAYYFDFIYAPIYEHDIITGISLVATDVTDQVETEMKLKENQVLFKELMEISDYSTAIYKGEDLVIDFANDQMIKTWGKTKSVIGQKLEVALPELAGQPFAEILRNVYRTGVPYIATEDVAVLEIDGNLRSFYFSFSYRPLRNANGEIFAILNMAMDVTELVEARIKALEGANEYKNLAESMPQIVWTTDENSRIIYCNENFLNFLDIKKSDILDFNFTKIVHPEDLEKFKVKWSEAQADKKMFEFEIRLFDLRQNKYIWFLNRSTPIVNDEGNIAKWIGTSTNIDEFKTLAAQKDTFLGIASHELKTPLTSLKLYAQVLERMLSKNGDVKTAEFAKKMDAQIVKLTSLIGDLLDVTKINSGKIYLNEDHFDFEKLVIETAEDQQMSTSYKIELKTQPVGMVFADRDRISQVITNLISNAIKYSPDADKIIIETKANDGNVQFSVQDFGIGMQEDKKDRVFDQYYRVSGDEESTFPGLGLGLYISSQIVERSHGKIGVTSTVGKGSTFFFKLPQVKI